MTESRFIDQWLKTINCKAKLHVHKRACSPVGPDLFTKFTGPDYPDNPGEEFHTESGAADLKAFLETPEGMIWFHEHRPKGVITVHAADRDVYVR